MTTKNEQSTTLSSFWQAFDIGHVKRAILVLFAYCFITFGQPAYSPICSFFASTIGFSLLFYQLAKLEPKARFICGGVFFFLVQSVQLFWCTYHPVVAARGVFLLLSLLMGLQFGLLCLLVTKKIICSRFWFLLIPALWTALEWSRIFWCSGFYFDLIGLSLATNLVTLQTASLFGVLGMSFWVMLTNVVILRAFLVLSLETAVRDAKAMQDLDPKSLLIGGEHSPTVKAPPIKSDFGSRGCVDLASPTAVSRLNKRSLTFALIVTLLPYIYGTLHLIYHTKAQEAYDAIHPQMNALIVHSKKVPDEFKPLPRIRLSPQERSFAAWKELVTAIAPFYKKQNLDLILMPEGVVPYGSATLLFNTAEINGLFLSELKTPFPPTNEDLLTSEDVAAYIAQLYKCPLIVGLEGIKRNQPSDRPLYYNSAFFFSDKPNIPPQRYDKQVLVPMGEYIPFDFAKKLAAKYGIYDSFTPGTGAKPFKSGDHRIGASICYEETVGNLMRQNSVQGATLLVNLTDDYWFPFSMLALQHFEHARPRTVENGVPLIRSCNFGVSGVVDSLGRCVLVKEGTEEPSGFVVRFSSYHYPTLYGKYGDWPILILTACILLLGVCYAIKRKRVCCINH